MTALLKRLGFLLVVLIILACSCGSLAESVDELWLDGDGIPSALYSDGICLCLSNANGEVHMEVERDGSLLLSTDCGECFGVFRSQPFYFSDTGLYTFTLNDGSSFRSATVRIERQPSPTAFDWLSY